MKKIYILVISCFILLSIFIYYKINMQDNFGDASFEIYLVSDQTIKNKNLEDIELESNPVITDKDIEKYIWKEHKIIFTKESPLPDFLNRSSHVKFIIVANKRRIYLGTYVSPISSAWTPSGVPLILYPKDKSLEIIFSGKGDPRNDRRIYNALKKLKKL